MFWILGAFGIMGFIKERWNEWTISICDSFRMRILIKDETIRTTTYDKLLGFVKRF